MTLQKRFVSKLVTLALSGTQIAGTVHAADWHDGDAAALSLTKKHVQELEQALVKQPHSALEKIVKLANNSFSIQKNGTTKISISLVYDTKLPPGQTTSITMAPDASDRVKYRLTVHPGVKNNAYILLDALVEVTNLYDLGQLGSSEFKTIYADEKLHPQDLHYPVKGYHLIEYSLTHALGFPQNTYNEHHPGATISGGMSPVEFMEIEANAYGGSVFAQRRLLDIVVRNFQFFKKGLSTFTLFKNLTEDQKKNQLIEYVKIKGVELSSQDTLGVSLKKMIDQVDLRNKKTIDELNALAKKTYREQVQAYKAGAEKREAVVKSLSLPEMLKSNDREGVAKAMETMLPWEIMEPSEKVFWSDFVDSVRHPNYDNAVILFRGLDSDEKLQAVTDAKGKVVNGAILSKRLTSGSGSHLFKLKGLVETFETFGTDGAMMNQRVSPLTQPHTLTQMMSNHANMPVGSPFISLTYSLDTAFSFASGATLKVSSVKALEKAKNTYINSNQSGGVATIRIDPRRLLVNSVSSYSQELEVLASMFIFPDEVLHLEKGVNYSIERADLVNASYSEKFQSQSVLIQDYYQRARQAVFQKTGMVLPESYEQLSNTGNNKFLTSLKDLESLFDRAAVNRPKRCESVFR